MVYLQKKACKRDIRHKITNFSSHNTDIPARKSSTRGKGTHSPISGHLAIFIPGTFGKRDEDEDEGRGIDIYIYKHNHLVHTFISHRITSHHITSSPSYQRNLQESMPTSHREFSSPLPCPYEVHVLPSSIPSLFSHLSPYLFLPTHPILIHAESHLDRSLSENIAPCR